MYIPLETQQWYGLGVNYVLKAGLDCCRITEGVKAERFPFTTNLKIYRWEHKPILN